MLLSYSTGTGAARLTYNTSKAVKDEHFIAAQSSSRFSDSGRTLPSAQSISRSPVSDSMSIARSRNRSSSGTPLLLAPRFHEAKRQEEGEALARELSQLSELKRGIEGSTDRTKSSNSVGARTGQDCEKRGTWCSSLSSTFEEDLCVGISMERERGVDEQGFLDLYSSLSCISHTPDQEFRQAGRRAEPARERGGGIYSLTGMTQLRKAVADADRLSQASGSELSVASGASSCREALPEEDAASHRAGAPIMSDTLSCLSYYISPPSARRPDDEAFETAEQCAGVAQGRQIVRESQGIQMSTPILHQIHPAESEARRRAGTLRMVGEPHMGGDSIFLSFEHRVMDSRSSTEEEVFDANAKGTNAYDIMSDTDVAPSPTRAATQRLRQELQQVYLRRWGGGSSCLETEAKTTPVTTYSPAPVSGSQSLSAAMPHTPEGRILPGAYRRPLAGAAALRAHNDMFDQQGVCVNVEQELAPGSNGCGQRLVQSIYHQEYGTGAAGRHGADDLLQLRERLLLQMHADAVEEGGGAWDQPSQQSEHEEPKSRGGSRKSSPSRSSGNISARRAHGMVFMPPTRSMGQVSPRA